MKLPRVLLWLASHGVVAAIGFAAGIYALPILTAPPAPTAAELHAAMAAAPLVGEFRRDLPGSDFLHWGEGEVRLGGGLVAFSGQLAPGPDYQLYLSPQLVQTEAEFEQRRAQMQRVGAIRQFDGFVLPLPADIDPADYGAVIIWCESFGEFITAASYR